MIKTRESVEDLPVALKNDERLQFADKMAEVANQIDELQLERANFLRTSTDRIREARQEQARLAGIVGTRHETRKVPVTESFNLSDGTYTKTRNDTGEIIDLRSLTPEEKQLSLLDAPRNDA